ncbi:hypothetical protein MUN89_21580 [Halobacillus salinarum]|uniref:Aminoglycoside-2''-adenylyltransferase n=1 Tax=Halobacillus salinarum TaxID=2932257 RepID=A0ABY4EQK4_9BACI|nr:hypothetical protein [Halobacillus salinarum]UOQ44381.1 hypothetical protein MUN89_21580 [Halobacillus salinarum]
MFDRCLEIKKWLKSFQGKWMVAGGWAIDLHIGEETRSHEDIEVAVFRNDQLSLIPVLKGWEAYFYSNGEAFLWDQKTYLEAPIHELHVINPAGEEVELLLNERKRDLFCFRRDKEITFPIERMQLHSEMGIPYLNPEIVLLYKAKYTKQKDEDDFNNIFPHLNERQKEWLKQSLIHYDRTHVWLEKLLY